MAKRSTIDAGRTVDKAATSKAPAPKHSNESTSTVDFARRRERIATAAYYRAERRNFQGNGELDDWLEAEREIDNAAPAGGIRSEASRRAEDSSNVSAPSLEEAANETEDPDRIDPGDVQRWAAELGVSASTLRVAIERAGPRVPDVKRFLVQHELRQR